jgi:hypothetical protein
MTPEYFEFDDVTVNESVTHASLIDDVITEDSTMYLRG